METYFLVWFTNITNITNWYNKGFKKTQLQFENMPKSVENHMAQLGHFEHMVFCLFWHIFAYLGMFLAYFGLFWPILAYFGLFWPILAYFGIYLAYFGIFWHILAYIWHILAYFGIFWHIFGIFCHILAYFVIFWHIFCIFCHIFQKNCVLFILKYISDEVNHTWKHVFINIFM